MIQIYYASTTIIKNINTEDLISGLSSGAKSKMEGFKRIEDKYLLLTSLFLLSKALIENGYDNYKLHDLEVTNFGRPFFPDSPFDFNISHTGDIASVVFSENCRVGIDIERIRGVDLSDFRTMFSPEQWHKIDSSDHKYRTFYYYWTLLESAVKADGRGLSLVTSNKAVILEDQILIDGKKWFFCHKNIDSTIVCCVTSDKESEEIELRLIS